MNDMSTANENQKALANLAGNAFVELVKKHSRAARVIGLAAVGIFCLYASGFEAMHK